MLTLTKWNRTFNKNLGDGPFWSSHISETVNATTNMLEHQYFRQELQMYSKEFNGKICIQNNISLNITKNLYSPWDKGKMTRLLVIVHLRSVDRDYQVRSIMSHILLLQEGNYLAVSLQCGNQFIIQRSDTLLKCQTSTVRTRMAQTLWIHIPTKFWFQLVQWFQRRRLKCRCCIYLKIHFFHANFWTITHIFSVPRFFMHIPVSHNKRTFFSLPFHRFLK